jgi:hypothetical protein
VLLVLLLHELVLFLAALLMLMIQLVLKRFLGMILMPLLWLPQVQWLGWELGLVT